MPVSGSFVLLLGLPTLGLAFAISVITTYGPVVLSDLTKRGVLASSRGGVHIVDRRALEAASCECYRGVAGARDNTGPRR